MMDNRPMANNADILSKLLRRSFVVNRRILPTDITNEMVIDTISGDKLRFNIYNTVSYIIFYVREIKNCYHLLFLQIDYYD